MKRLLTGDGWDSSVQKEKNGKTLQDYQKSLRKYATPQEKEFKKVMRIECVARDTRFTFQKIFWTGIKGYIVDFWVPEYRVVFEIDGHHHLNGKQLKDDLERDTWFACQGIQVVRLLNSRIGEAREVITLAFQGRPRRRLRLRERKRKALQKMCKKELDGSGREITICPEITKDMTIKTKRQKPSKKKKRGCRMETPGTFSGSVLWRR